MSAKKIVCVLDPYHQDAVALLQSEPDLEVVPPDDPRKSHWREIADGILVRSETRITAEVLNAASRLQVVVKQGVGVDNIDLDAAKERGVAVHNTPALNSEAVAELSLALALSLSRRVTELDRRIRSGERVVRSNALGMSLLKKTVGVVGMGNIGHAAARKWIGACEASVIGYDPVAPDGIWPDIPHKRVASLDELLRTADVVTLHVPLMQSTRGLIGARELTLMRDNAILINAARGGIVDEAALLRELRQGRLWGAVLDAVEEEPPTLEKHRDFLKLDNVIMTPHIGGSTMENQRESGQAAARTLMAVLRGETSIGGKLV